ncbi:MAG TPA: hypothetical protein VL988_10135 [Solirubrobacteraceae bacterium]|nr:hypothetical protein [Solirubrobacteraceae bacterium]
MRRPLRATGALLVAGALAALAPLAVAGSPALAQPPTEAGCPVFPADNPINQDISGAPVDPRSSRYIDAIGANGHLHASFSNTLRYGIPYTVVGPQQPKVPVRILYSRATSDPGPYPIPLEAPVQADPGGDRHVLVLQSGTCKLYELYAARRHGGGWEAGSGAVFDLRSNALRPDGWTSADAAGLPIFPLLARYQEARAGSIDHALRVTVERTQRGYIHPATHFSSSERNPNLPPMGLRLRLKASFDLSGYYGQALVVLRALKRYGLIVADEGGSWNIGGAPNPGWVDHDLQQLERVPGSAFEAVGTGRILHKGPTFHRHGRHRRPA